MAPTSDDLKLQVSHTSVVSDNVADEAIKDTREADAALSFTLGEVVTYDEADNKRIRRMIDRHIMPWMFFTFTVQYFDKTLLSYASVMGIIQDTKLTKSDYAWYVLLSSDLEAA